jgi:hypothetical protein
MSSIMCSRKILLVFLIFSVFSCASPNFFSTTEPTGRYPIRQLSLTINEEDYELLFVELEEFSTQHNLEYSLSFYDFKERGRRFSIIMKGELFQIVALSMPDTEQLDFSFVLDDLSKKPSEELVDKIYNDLKVYVKSIPSVVIVSEE